MSRQQQHTAERNSFVTWEIIVETKVEKNHRKNVATQYFMSQHNEELKAKIFVATKGSYVVTHVEEKRLQENRRLS